MESSTFRIRIIPSNVRDLSALALFRLGYDTKDIAISKGMSESRIYNWISASREGERNRADIRAAGHTN